jgi:zinc/manganese transport system substrate-binding protein
MKKLAFKLNIPMLRQLLISVIALITLFGSTVHADNKVVVTASFSILGDLVKVVGGDRVSVVTLVGPDEDAHVFEARPSDAKNLLKSKLFVINGLGFEPWAIKLAKSADYKGKYVIATTGVKGIKISAESEHAEDEHAEDKHAEDKHAEDKHSEVDPHAWQNPENVVLYVRNIAAGLAMVDPTGASTYLANAKAYVIQLQALNTWAKENIGAIAPDKRKVITSHDAFGYLGEQYKIKFLAPQGGSTESAPSAKGVATIIKQIQREKIKAVFVENMSDPKLIVQLSKDVGVTVGATLYADALSGTDKPGATYLKMMRHNIMQLVAGMALN